jgi:putative Mg2+ transporter-C (MgtC) family protein
MQNIITYLIPLVCSILCGGLIGLERYIHEKPAGMRTNILICMGACLFTIISQKIGTGDNARIAAQIVTGIGFLGAGVIFRSPESVHGLTTAAGIWMVAALGMACGCGMYLLAFVCTLLAIVVLIVLQPIEKRLIKFHKQKQENHNNN